ncbi:MAG: hypothetical protein JSR37_00985 [Verrucomicrobia bacterium]|nr:hypothetical protein [Verrucomicrobiota bacterium]MBS0636695.1 hypothetical protein [Verrucomicrobiota bacterium]
MSWWTGSTASKSVSEGVATLWTQYVAPHVPEALKSVVNELEQGVALPATGLLYVPGLARLTVRHLNDGEWADAAKMALCGTVILSYAATKPIKDVAVATLGLFTLYQGASLLSSCCCYPKIKRRQEQRVEETFKRICPMCERATNLKLKEPFLSCSKCSHFGYVRVEESKIKLDL